jgi:hypothetical protein
MKKRLLWLGMLVMALVFGMTVVGCDNDSTNNGNGTVGGNGTVNLQNQHGTDSIYWFEMKNNGIVTIGEQVEVKPYFSKQFQVPAGTYIAGVTAGSAQDLRTCIVTVSGGQTVTLIFNGSLSQQ